MKLRIVSIFFPCGPFVSAGGAFSFAIGHLDSPVRLYGYHKFLAIRARIRVRFSIYFILLPRADHV